MANTCPITYGLKWSFEVVAIPNGAKPMEVQSAQRLLVNQGYAASGGTPPGIITLACTGAYPTTSNMTTALSAAATAAGVILNANPSLGQWQGFASGGG